MEDRHVGNVFPSLGLISIQFYAAYTKAQVTSVELFKLNVAKQISSYQH